jgi:hypothetical protein
MRKIFWTVFLLSGLHGQMMVFAPKKETLNKMNHPDKENANPTLSACSISNSGPSRAAENQIELEQLHADNYKCWLHNEHHALQCPRKSRDKLHAEATVVKDELAVVKEDLAQTLDKNAEFKRDKNKLQMCCSHAPSKQDNAIKKAKMHQVKEKGVIREIDWEMVWDLIKLGVLVSGVSSAIHTVSNSLEVVVDGGIDGHSISRIVHEGKVAAEMQIAHKIHNVQGMVC